MGDLLPHAPHPYHQRFISSARNWDTYYLDVLHVKGGVFRSGVGGCGPGRCFGRTLRFGDIEIPRQKNFGEFLELLGTAIKSIKSFLFQLRRVSSFGAKRGLLVQEVEAAEGNENGNKIVDPEQEKNTKCCFIFLAWRFVNEIIFYATEGKRQFLRRFGDSLWGVKVKFVYKC
jgi:hypothetical protein